MKKPNDFKQQFVDFINRHDLITSGDHIGIAVSGGIDSMTLLDLFERARDEFRLKLCVLHFNHQLRDQAERDQTFVENACRQKNITFIIDSADVAAFAKTQNLSIEMAARELRYAFFEKTAQKLSLNKIATGHNASDQAETVLDHIVRGTGIGGLAGIPVKRDRYIRPLLFSERIDIEKYAEQESISFRIDASNVDQIFKRNRIRHSLLPLLQKEFNPQITRSINRLSDHAIEANTIIENVVDEAFHNCAG